VLDQATTSSAPGGFARPPAWAGSFYPSDPKQLRQKVTNYLQQATVTLNRAPKALIVPHAGYEYSGPIAASAFATLRQNCPVQTVVLLGPSHHVEFGGLAMSGPGDWATPLGLVRVDPQAPEKVRELSQVRELNRPHGNEHCLEVELPFLQCTLTNFQIIPLLVGETTDEEIAQVIETLWGGPETIILVSSDLSHYLSYADGQRVDRATADAIRELRPDAIARDQACGQKGIRGLLQAARRQGMQCQVLDLRSSGDTSNRRDRVVGYGAFAFLE
jgi:MEMO1 family protein